MIINYAINCIIKNFVVPLHCVKKNIILNFKSFMQINREKFCAFDNNSYLCMRKKKITYEKGFIHVGSCLGGDSVAVVV